jgi:excisionase family DNA binding protein
MSAEMLSVDEAGRQLGVSRSTVLRLIKRGDLPSITRGGRRLVPAGALRRRSRAPAAARIPPLTEDHPIFRLVGAGRGGRTVPGARDKHAILDK